jgi:hypothetical protein
LKTVKQLEEKKSALGAWIPSENIKCDQTLKITNLIFEIRDFECLVAFNAWLHLMFSLGTKKLMEDFF